MKLTKVEKIGEMAIHFYELNGVVEAQECTLEEYASLALPGAGAPNLPEGAKWVQSIQRVKFDTPDGTVGEGEYGIDETNAIVNLPGTQELVIPASEIDKDIISEKGIEIVNKQSQPMKILNLKKL